MDASQVAGTAIQLFAELTGDVSSLHVDPSFARRSQYRRPVAHGMLPVALLPFHPALEDPSNILPSSKRSSSTVLAGTVTCCSLPLVSVNRKSTNLTSFSLIRLITSAALIGVSSRFDVSIEKG